jgi:hypothetical protein
VHKQGKLFNHSRERSTTKTEEGLQRCKERFETSQVKGDEDNTDEESMCQEYISDSEDSLVVASIVDMSDSESTSGEKEGEGGVDGLIDEKSEFWVCPRSEMEPWNHCLCRLAHVMSKEENECEFRIKIRGKCKYRLRFGVKTGEGPEWLLYSFTHDKVTTETWTSNELIRQFVDLAQRIPFVSIARPHETNRLVLKDSVVKIQRPQGDHQTFV